jgi:AcrR family transcriptional regulator
MTEKLQGRERILKATLQLLKSGGAEAVTVRRVAKKAGVGVGLINYHFGSKDDLLFEAVNSIVGDAAALWYQPFAYPDLEAETRLRQLFRESVKWVGDYPQYFKLAVRHELLEGSFEVPQLILPLLREIFGGEKKELELRLLAFSLIVTLQMALLRPEAFGRYSGVDVFDEDQRAVTMDILVNQALCGRIREERQGKV